MASHSKKEEASFQHQRTLGILDLMEGSLGNMRMVLEVCNLVHCDGSNGQPHDLWADIDKNLLNSVAFHDKSSVSFDRTNSDLGEGTLDGEDQNILVYKCEEHNYQDVSMFCYNLYRNFGKKVVVVNCYSLK